MPGAEIIRREVVIPIDVGLDEYDNLIFHNEDGDKYKINKKRVEKLQDEIIVEQAVELGWANYKPPDSDKSFDYIAVAHLVDNLPDELKPSIPAKEPKPEVKEPPFEQPAPKPEAKHFVSGEERGMWFKELGNRIGDGSLEKDYPKANVKIKGQYYKKMSEVTGVDFH